LFDELREAIITQRFLPGSRIPSINKIQAKYRVSRETSKLVLNKLAHAGLIIKRPGKGSFVADLGRRQKKWAVLVPFYSAHTEQLLFFIKEQAKQIHREVEHFVTYNYWQEEIRLVGTMIQERYEAVVVIPTFDESQTAAFYRKLVSGGTVVTLLDHTMAGSYFTYAIQSYDLGVKRGVNYLLDNTKGNLAFVKNETWMDRNMVQELMEKTFKTFIENTRRKAVVISSIRELSVEFIEKQKISGFFCCDDLDAVRIIGRIREWHLSLPGDIRLVSYGNTDVARYFSPKITAIDSHAQEMASRTKDIILCQINGDGVPDAQYVIQPDLIIRET
jgi:DNA-binding LacI/PurR family transcriptional regulator